MATILATRSCWIPWVMRRSCCRTSTWTTAPPWTAGQGACAGVTPGSGGHEDSLPRRAGWPADRSPSTQETHGLYNGHPAFQGATEGPVARCALRWESLSDRPAVGRRPGDPQAPRMWVLVVPLPVLHIYLYACKVLTHTHTHKSTFSQPQRHRSERRFSIPLLRLKVVSDNGTSDEAEIPERSLRCGGLPG